MGTHKDLDVWKLSIDFVEEIYRITEKFPSEERFGLISQLRRAAVSISSNIAEGAARKSDKENIQFLYVALGSIAEIETQLIISNRLGYCDVPEIQNMLIIIKSKLINYIKYLKTLSGKRKT